MHFRLKIAKGPAEEMAKRGFSKAYLYLLFYVKTLGNF